MTTYDPTGGYPHPDHVMCHRVSVEAFAAAGNPDRYVGHGEPWTPLKLYYNHGFSLARLRAIHDAIVEAGGESPFGDWIDSRQAREITEREVTTHVECADYFDQRDAALRAHATQIDPEGFFFAVPREIELAQWSTEEFELAESRVPASLPETDLFAGIRPGGQGAGGAAMRALVLFLATPSPNPAVESVSGGSPGFIGFVVRFRAGGGRGRPVPVPHASPAPRRPAREQLRADDEARPDPTASTGPHEPSVAEPGAAEGGAGAAPGGARR